MSQDKRLDKLEDAFSGLHVNALPDYSKMQLADWSTKVRRKVEGKNRAFLLPMWKKIYEDYIGFQMIVGGRQIFKSTAFGDMLGHLGTSKRGSTGIYVTHDDLSLMAFSYDKFRQSVLEDNPIIGQFVRGKTYGQVHRIAYKLGSKTYLVTDEGGFKHVEGKSPDLLILDEGQKLEFEHWVKMRESMATTQGRVIIGGIGGEEGSQYHSFWKSTNQCKWVPKYETWREKLEHDNQGLVWGEYMLDYLDGEWVPQAPENYQRHGYWLPQTIFPHIPLTIFDAQEKYHTDIEYSIEWKQNNYPQTDYLNHVMGQFYEGTKRPLTEEIVRACMRPYSYLDLLTGYEVRELKATFGHDITVYMGVDYGSGNTGASKTVCSIWIKWKARPEIGLALDRWQLAAIRDTWPNDDDFKAYEIWKMAVEYDIDFGVGDMGYGEHINKKLRYGSINPENPQARYEGLKRKFKGCWTRRDPVQVISDEKKEQDESGTKEPHITIDKSSSILLFIDFIKRQTRHPRPEVAMSLWNDGEVHTNNSEFRWNRSQVIIPYSNPRKVDWLVKEFTRIERKDIEEEDISKPDKRQIARIEFNHPPDAVMSTIYNFVADANFDSDPFKILGVRQRR